MLHSIAKPAATALLLLLAAGCAKPVVSDESAVAQSIATYGVSEHNLRATPRRSPIAVGDTLPDLVWLDQQERELSTIELTSGGDAVLIFSPGDGEANARPIYPWVRQHGNLVRSRGAEIVVVTPDEPAINAGVAGSEQLRIALASDPSAWGARCFGLVRTREGTAVSQPWTVIIGREGRVLAIQPGLMDVTDVLTALHMRPTGGKDFKVIDMLTK